MPLSLSDVEVGRGSQEVGKGDGSNTFQSKMNTRAQQCDPRSESWQFLFPTVSLSPKVLLAGGETLMEIQHGLLADRHSSDHNNEQTLKVCAVGTLTPIF